MDIKIIALFVAISIVAVIYLTTRIRLQAFIALFIVSIFLAFTTLPASKVLSTINEGFGGTMASIGFLIILGAIIGIILDRTRATLSMAKWVLSGIGQSRSPVALGITGFITGLPIFCNSGFIILSGLARSFSIKSGIVMPLMATILATSLYSVHCLIPPHPGATAAAVIIGTDLSTLIMAGIIFAIPGAIAAFFWSRLMVKGMKYEPAKRKTEDASLEEGDLPGVLISFMPVMVPLLLITLKSVTVIIDKDGSGLIYRLLYFPGEPVFALSIGVLLSLLLIKDKGIETFNSVFSEAIEKAGPILIVTAAGGMFGMVIKETGIGEEMGKLFAGMGIGLLVPFLISAILKTAQGSSTVAIITTASFIVPMLGSLGLDSEMGKLLALLSMGAGSMLVSHANDSYFWVVNNFSEIEVDATLRVYSSSTIVMGITVFLCIYISSFFLL